MTQTQHTTRSCSSSSSSNDLKHAQQRRRRQMSRQFNIVLLVLLLLNSWMGTVAGAATAQSRFFYTAAETQQQTQTSDPAAAEVAAEATSCCPSATDEPVTLTSDLGNITAGYDGTDGSAESKEIFKRSVKRRVKDAVSASCSPQPTIVELLPLAREADEETSVNVHYRPQCTRINRCNGCCGVALSCQPTQTEMVEMCVKRTHVEMPGKVTCVIVTVEKHLACKCDCRKKPGDCNPYQEYRKDLCRCECTNTDARDKCLQHSDLKYWDPANCTCACQHNQSCTTGTDFDEALCKCTDIKSLEYYS
ncbi:uncharacterized protein LOC6566241 isoform X2 [Drosophila grimshawi]|uniref:uncharacterized protein LOC6566241 isoform X2 n=1 Tax=Drosophila grimshawi TaxID=7222 RepID=UPI000C86F4A6|nr:uncharacterized protein LOC6566241 isoform X2 [Drosophila grimshawi]